MEDRTALNCEGIKKHLKPFLEDLLAEDEYQAYVCHLNTCAKCKDYVGRFGSLSNQLRELGNIKVPSDFYSTVCFNISQPVEEQETPKENRTKNLIAGIVILAVISTGIFAGVIYFKKSGSSHKTEGPPIIVTQMTAEKNPLSARESEALLGELQSIATSLGTPGKKEDVEGAAVRASSAGGGVQAKENNAAAPKVRPLHWHFQYSEISKDDGLKKELEEADLRIQKKLEAKETLLAEIELLKQKTQQVELGKQYSKKERDVKSNEDLQAADKLRKKQEELEALISGVSHLKEERQGAEDLLRRLSGEKLRKKADRKGKLLNALAVLNIKLDYQKYDILAFTATGEKNRSVLRQILFISAASFGDFTADVPTFLDKEQKVSIYLSNDSDSALHWHAKESGVGKKTDLFNAVRELGGSIDYESNELAVFSIPNAELKNLRVRVQAMRIPLTEYGAEDSKDGILSSGPVAVSIYFTN